MKRKLYSALLTAAAVLFMACILALPASAATSISKATVTYTSSYQYTGSYIKPKVTVKLSGKTVSSKNYTVTYKNNKNVGKATLTVKGKGDYTGSVSKNFYITPAALKNVKSSVTTSKVTLTWSKGTGVKAYQIFMYNNDTGKWVKEKTVTGTKATISGLEPGTVYKFRIRAYAKSGKYLYSPYTYKTVKTKLNKVTGLTSAADVNSVTLSWKEVKNAASYKIYFYDDAAGKWKGKKTVKTNTATVSKLTSATTYRVRVRAYSKTGSIEVYGSYSSSIYASTKPEAVQSVTVTDYTSTTATLSWPAVDRATKYYIYVGKTTDPDVAPTFKKTKSTTKTSYKMTDLDSCCYYSFRILPQYKSTDGKNFYGKSAQSEMIFTPVAKVKNFKVSEVTNATATLTWTAQPYATGYTLSMRKTGESEITRIATLTADQNTYTVYGLDELTDYRFYIRAYYTAKDGTELKGTTAGVVTSTDDGHVDSVTFTKTKGSIYVDYTSTFEVSVQPYYATNPEVQFSSSNEKVATIDKNGKVKGLKAGTTTITVTSVDGGLTDSVTVKIVPLKSKSITVPSTITAYTGETMIITPTFSPKKTTDKSFTVTGKNHTYTYKGGILGLQTLTGTCKFSDYVTVAANGQIIPKQPTVEPETGKRFSFTVTVKANDTGVSDTTKLSIITRPIKIAYHGNDNPWVYGNSAKLTATLSSTAEFTKDQLIWQSSDTSVATVSSDGTVTCVGTGAVTITAYSPDKAHSASIQLAVSPQLIVDSCFYSSCIPGDAYVISVSTLPENAEYSFNSLNENTVSVTDSGVVTFLKEGTGTVILSSGIATKAIVFTSESWTKPDTDSGSLLDLSVSKLNGVKKDMPMLIRSDSSVFSSFVIANPNSHMTAEEFEDLFAEYASPSSRVVSAVNEDDYSSTTDYNSARSKYLSSVPVAGNSATVLDGLDLSDLQSIEYIDNNEPTYAVRFTLKSESMPSASYATAGTSHGKVFDILTGSLIKDITDSLDSADSITVTYDNFAQYYSNSSVTVTIDKITGNVENIDYDMNLTVNITNLNISMLISAFDSDLKFDVNNRVEIDVIN